MLIRLQRFLADCGIASRRECEAMIQDGRVRVNGEVRASMPVMVDPQADVIALDDEPVRGQPDAEPGPKKELIEEPKVYFLLNKPKGILVTARDPDGRKTVGELMKGVRERVFPVGRLDMDSRGALIMTNDGDLANRLTHPRYSVEKTYVVEVDGRVGHGDFEKMKQGLWLGPDRGTGVSPVKPRRDTDATPPRGSKTERFSVKLLGRERGRSILEVRISESKNREIRRVMARLGHAVRDLNRVAIGEKITLRGVDVGAFRPLSPKEVEWLYHVSSLEYHARTQAATQAWYEQKEMVKERKRLAKESAENHAHGRPVALRDNARPNGTKPKGHVEKPRRLRPEHKGKRPFVPPTGRNAGKPLGGNKIGRQRMLQPEELEDAPQPSAHVDHPLGNEATSED